MNKNVKNILNMFLMHGIEVLVALLKEILQDQDCAQLL